MIKKTFAILILCLAGLGSPSYTAYASTEVTVTVQPDRIQMGATYNGERITVTGQIPADTDALVRVMGKEEKYNLKQKGRALGVLWMNLGSVEVSNVPSIFLLYLPESNQSESTSGPEMWSALKVGLAGVREQADIVGQHVDKDILFKEFVKLKEESGQYAVVANGVHYSRNDGKMRWFSSTMALPATLPQGTYRVEIFAIRKGDIAASAARQIKAMEVGMPAWISALAFNHGALYGVLSVMMALIAGLLTGLLFRGEKGAH
ncbi:MAG: TIGR02186 family protein [Proteobacteria bacterium]|nr:TIGR02186 family protein [Pseudomonadota bacterium]